jgi:hypothetical protein
MVHGTARLDGAYAPRWEVWTAPAGSGGRAAVAKASCSKVRSLSLRTCAGTTWPVPTDECQQKIATRT